MEAARHGGKPETRGDGEAQHAHHPETRGHAQAIEAGQGHEPAIRRGVEHDLALRMEHGAAGEHRHHHGGRAVKDERVPGPGGVTERTQPQERQPAERGERQRAIGITHAEDVQVARAQDERTVREPDRHERETEHRQSRERRLHRASRARWLALAAGSRESHHRRGEDEQHDREPGKERVSARRQDAVPQAHERGHLQPGICMGAGAHGLEERAPEAKVLVDLLIPNEDGREGKARQRPCPTEACGGPPCARGRAEVREPQRHEHGTERAGSNRSRSDCSTPAAPKTASHRRCPVSRWACIDARAMGSRFHRQRLQMSRLG